MTLRPVESPRDALLRHAGDAMIDAARFAAKAPWLSSVRARDAATLRAMARQLTEGPK